MKEVREYTVQTFDEFGEADQKKILDNYRNINTDNDWWYEGDWYVEHLREMGFTTKYNKVYFRLFCQGAYATFDCEDADFDILLADLDIKHKDFWIRHIKANDMGWKTEGESYPEWESNSYLEYIGAEERLPFCSAEYEKIKDHINNKINDACEWLYKALLDEYEYLESDEGVRETIECNEYMFDTETLRIA